MAQPYVTNGRFHLDLNPITVCLNSASFTTVRQMSPAIKQVYANWITLDDNDEWVQLGRAVLMTPGHLAFFGGLERLPVRMSTEDFLLTGRDVGRRLRQHLLVDGVTWVGAELESVDHLLNTGVSAKLTTSEPKPPLALMEAADVTNFRTELARLRPAIDIDPSLDAGQRKLRAIHDGLISRSWKMILLIGGSPGTWWRSRLAVIRRDTKLVVWDPRPFEGVPPDHPNLTTVDSLCDEATFLAFYNRLPRKIKRNMLISLDIRRDKEEVRRSGASWEDAVNADQILMCRIAQAACRERSWVLLKVRPIYDSDYTPIMDAPLLAQPWIHEKSHEARQLVRSETSIINIRTSDFIMQAFEYNVAREHQPLLDTLVQKRWAWAGIDLVSRRSYLKDRRAIGLYSISNRQNGIQDICKFIRRGGVMTMPFVSLLRSERDGGISVFAEPGQSEHYEDHTMDAVMQFEFEQAMIPVFNFLARVETATLNRQSLTTVIFEKMRQYQQTASNPSAWLVKGISAALRKIPPATLSYDLRLDAFNYPRPPWYNSNDLIGPGFRDPTRPGKRPVCDYTVNGEIRLVSGHLMYLMLGEASGIPVGMRKYFSEKLYNARTLEAGYERGDDTLWHTADEDWYATYIAEQLWKHVLEYSSVDPMGPIVVRFYAYSSRVRQLIIETLEQEPLYGDSSRLTRAT
uniref:VP3 n=1 Tax=viral metagenome TaxID=1070528 RepID=A0A2V0RAX8_9ZZZZ